MKESEELVDLVDQNGKIQKQNIPRSEVDKYPNLHLQIVIVAIFNSRGQILVHERASSKTVDQNKIDLVCGGIKAGEGPKEAAERESLEETGVKPDKLEIVLQGLNSYNRFRYLLRGFSADEPVLDPNEAEWVRFVDPDELRVNQVSGEMTFVDEFFEDLELASPKNN